jgi:hypothetical protein
MLKRDARLSGIRITREWNSDNAGAGQRRRRRLVRGDDDRLVFAARMQHMQDHQLGLREQPLFGFRAGGFSGTDDAAEVLELRNVPEMIETDAGQNTDFVFGEYFLAELDSHHL